MALHTNANRISQVQLDKLYDIHDAHAVHTLADLAGLGMPTEGIFVFKGTVATVAALPKENNTVGDVWHVTENHSEYIWAKVDGGTTEGWEEFGEHFVVDHAHNAELSGSIQSDGSAAAQTWTQKTGTISGTAAAQEWTQKTGTISGTAAAQTWTQSADGNSVTVAGSNKASAVNGSGTVSVPTISESAKYAKVSTESDTFVKSYPGATSKMVTTTVTGVDGSVTASKAKAGTAVVVAKAGTAKSIPNVTGNTSVTASKVSNVAQRSIPNVTGNTSATATKTVFGTSKEASKITAAARTASQVKTAGSVTAGDQGKLPTWKATVTNEILSFEFGAGTLPTMTEVTLPTFEDVNVSEITDNTAVTVPVVTSNEEVTATKTTLGTAISATYLTAEDVTATNTTLGTAISVTPAVDNGSITPYTFDDVTVPKAAENATTVATGSLNSNGTGSVVMTGLGTATTASALKSASLVAATSATDGIHTGDDVTIGSESKTVNISGTAAAQEWTQGTSSVIIKGTNAASSVSGSATVTGTNAASSVSGSATVTGTNAASKVTGSVKVSGNTAGPQALQ